MAREVASATALALVALGGLAGAARLDVGGVTRPGPGFFPLLLSAALLLVSGVLFAGALRRQPAAADTADERTGWRLAATLGALILYVALFERVGFVMATSGFLAFLLGALARYRWPIAVGVAVTIAFAARLVFDRWLSVRLPLDVWGR
jgi:hypothetical protein